MSKFGNINSVIQSDPFNSGKLNILSIMSIVFISLETLLARIFYGRGRDTVSGVVVDGEGVVDAGGGLVEGIVILSPEAQFFQIMFSLWMFAFTGIVIHELLGRSSVNWNYNFYVPKKQLIILGAFAFFFGVFMQIVAYTLTLGATEMIPFSASTLGANWYLINLGAAIAEEGAFAWGFLGIWLMLLKGVGVGQLRLISALIANATLFTVYHYAVAGVLHQGELNFLPAMFLFRIALDISFILSNYDLSVPLIGHFLTNLFKGIAGNSLAQDIVNQGGVIAP